MRRYPDRGLTGRAVQDIGLRIVRGDITPGETIDVDALAGGFDVSRTVIREALRVLSGKGLVDARPRRGTYVKERTNWNQLDPDLLRWQFEALSDTVALDRLAEVRAMIEPAAAALAAQRRDDADLESLRSALDEMDVPDDVTDAIVVADLRFHHAMLAATHNELIEGMAPIIEIGLRARDSYVHDHRVSIKIGLPAHLAVFEAVKRQDAVAAKAAMADLVEDAAQEVRQVRRRGTGRKQSPQKKRTAKKHTAAH